MGRERVYGQRNITVEKEGSLKRGGSLATGSRGAWGGLDGVRLCRDCICMKGQEKTRCEAMQFPLKSVCLMFLTPASLRVLRRPRGNHTLSQALLGWKYEEAFEESQKYKEGKYILEKTCITKDPDGE